MLCIYVMFICPFILSSTLFVDVAWVALLFFGQVFLRYLEVNFVLVVVGISCFVSGYQLQKTVGLWWLFW